MAVETSDVLADVRAGKYEPWICLDTYLVAYLAELLTKLRDEGMSYSARFNTPGQWKFYLTHLINSLEGYDTEDPIAYAKTQEALHQIAAHLSDFWD